MRGVRGCSGRGGGGHGAEKGEGRVRGRREGGRGGEVRDEATVVVRVQVGVEEKKACAVWLGVGT